jgi:quinol-cytochrome oxidoreductase complex cytochrome b subunit
MVSIESVYDKMKKWVSPFLYGKGFSDQLTGYMTGELQTLVFIMILASLFRIFSVPLGIVVLVGAVAGILYFTPVLRRVQKESSNDLNTVLFWVVIYFAVIIAVTVWGR